MHVKPAHLDELKQLLTCANERGEKISSVDLSAFRRVLDHKAEDMTATVEAGLTLADFQSELAKHRQWLPVDPSQATNLSIARLLSTNVSGPHRFGYGTVGDYLIGMKVMLANGELIAPGGKVVKNVAGYDLAKLFIGGQDSLGVIVEATFKLRPLPEKEQFVQQAVLTIPDVKQLLETVLDSALTPVVFDLHNVSTNNRFCVVLGFAGMKEEVEWQVAEAAKLGFTVPSSLDYERAFWEQSASSRKLSVLPSRLTEALPSLAGTSFVARAGNGIVFHRANVPVQKANLPTDLFARLKNEFDPKHIFPELAV